MAGRIIGKMAKLNMKISKDSNLGKGFQVGHSYFCLNKPLENATEEEWYNDIINLEIQPLLEEYWFDKSDDVEQAIEELKR